MPLRMRPNCNFSYAGLKTAVRLAIEAEAPGPPTDDNRQVSRPLLLSNFKTPSLKIDDA